MPLSERDTRVLHSSFRDFWPSGRARLVSPAGITLPSAVAIHPETATAEVEASGLAIDWPFVPIPRANDILRHARIITA